MIKLKKIQIIEDLLANIQAIRLTQQRNTAVALDVGKDSIKLVELTREGEKLSLSKIDLAKIPSPQPGAGGKNDLIKKLIINLLARNQISQKDIVLGITGQSVFIKFLKILPVAREKLEQTIKYEAQQQIPFSLDEVEWDAHLFEQAQGEEPSAYRLLLVAIKKDNLTSTIKLAEKAGLKPSILDISTLSLYNCVRFNQDYDENKITLAVDIGAQSTDLVVLQGGDLWMRNFAIGGDNISAALEDLYGEIARSIEYYHFQQGPNAANELDTILLSGGGSLAPGLDKLLAQRFSCQVRRLEPFKMLHLDEQIKNKLKLQDKILFSQAVGLALRGLSRSRIKINLLKGQIKAKRLVYQKVAYGVGSLVLALAILFTASTFMRRDYRDKNLRLRRLKGSLETFSAYQPQIDELQKKKELLCRRINMLGDLAANRALWLKALSQLQKMLPDELWVTDFSGTTAFNAVEKDFESKLDLQGKAASYEGVNVFVSRLKSSTLFAEVKPLSSSFIKEELKDKERVEVVKFSVSIKVLPEQIRGE